MIQASNLVPLLILEIISCVFLGFVYLRLLNKKSSTSSEPIVFFLLCSTVIYLGIPLLMLTFNWQWHDTIYYNENYLYANLIAFLYIILVSVFYLLLLINSQNKTQKNEIQNPTDYINFTSRQRIIFIVLFLLPVWLDTMFLVRYMFQFGVAEYLINRIVLRKGMGLYVLISYMSIIVLPILFADILISIKDKSTVFKFGTLSLFLIGGVLPFMIAYVAMSNRLPAFILSILLIAVYLIVEEVKITIWKTVMFALGSILLFFFFTFAGYLRYVQGDLTQVEYSTILTILGNEAEHAFVFNFGNFEHLLWLIQNQSKWHPVLGESFIAGFMNFIPRSIYPDKLLGGGPILKNIINPGSYNLLGKNITSYTTGIAIETYMNFKFWGLFIVPFIHALVLLYLKRMYSLIKGNIILLTIYLMFVIYSSFLLLFGEFLGMFTQAIILAIPFLLFHWFSTTKFVIRTNV